MGRVVVETGVLSIGSGFGLGDDGFRFREVVSLGGVWCGHGLGTAQLKVLAPGICVE